MSARFTCICLIVAHKTWKITCIKLFTTLKSFAPPFGWNELIIIQMQDIIMSICVVVFLFELWPMIKEIDRNTIINLFWLNFFIYIDS